MESEGFDVEEWDADFLDQLVQAEELALSTQASLQQQYPCVPPEPPRPPVCDVSYSPPRELSQRVPEVPCAGGGIDSFDAFAPRETNSAKQQEIDRLKKELDRVSKQLNDLEQECSEVKRARDEKEEQLKVIHSRIEAEAKDAEFHHTESTSTDRLMAPGSSAACQNANLSNNQGQNVVGIHSDKATEESSSTGQNGYCVSEKLINLWNSHDRELGKVLVTKLFATCEADFQVLFGYLNSPPNNSDMVLAIKQSPAQSIEAAKVSHLYSVLSLISNGASRLENLLEALVDLCNLQNVVIIQRSLCVLRTTLSNFFTMKKEFGQRENVLFEESSAGDTVVDVNGCGNLENKNQYIKNLAQIFKKGQIPDGVNFLNNENPGRGLFDHSFSTSMSVTFWVSLVERMCQIAVSNNKEQIRHEVLLIVNLILMRQNGYMERDKFARELVFQSLSQLLRREAGVSVQIQAVHAVHLLCNCPKVIAMLSSGSKEDRDLSSSKDIDENNYSTFQELNNILTGFADCLACYGSSTAEEMVLRRNAIIFLAFLGSSGRSGFEILLHFQLPKGTHFLQIILQSLTSDLDLQASKPTPRPVLHEQWLLIREALIFLNRLVSHPQYSVPVLQALTNTREMASMTVDIAHRLTQKSKISWQDEITRKQTREYELVDLAWVFKKRVFAFLGDNIS
ncbi:protein SENSITIVE TO UV 2 isoform X2 [Andrographis paniculata]|uniref:protein SENSITIVE TO UV 2 isoform X2 n=1 Tax=Andrographis paniculata TaxID=175694 RepID=UPI0021E8F63D|nr:protein SENSITIVE TO UV 2 isoform X2 [Andrographis paniculata]